MTKDDLLHFAYLTGGFTTRSDTARENAELIAELALRGLLWTLTPQDGFGNVWRLTPSGVAQLPFRWPYDDENPAYDTPTN